MMTDRSGLAEDFLNENGFEPSDLRLIAGDASNRKYFRFKTKGHHYLLMDADPSLGEDVGPFVKISAHLRLSGLSAPEVYAEDLASGFLVIEDFGDAVFARLFDARLYDESSLYGAACDVLTRLQSQESPQLESYSAPLMTDLAMLSTQWYQRTLTDDDVTAQEEELRRTLTDLLSLLDAARVTILRDYHAENLIWLENRKGVQRVGLLDFQDAMLGHPAYDLVSILQDARRDVAPDVIDQVKDRFISSAGFDPGEFHFAYNALGLQRNLRILGIFARLCIRDNKPNYLNYVPRVWRHIIGSLDALENQSLKQAVTHALTPPDSQILALLSRQAA